MEVEAGRFVDALRAIIRYAVYSLAVLMVFVIVMGVADVVWVLYQRLLAPPRYLLQISDILATFGAFMAVLIAIEIFVNITVYLQRDVIHVKIVMATAVMAIARKIIILDFAQTTSEDIWGLAAVTLAISLGYWFVVIQPASPAPDGGGRGQLEHGREHDEALLGAPPSGANTATHAPRPRWPRPGPRRRPGPRHAGARTGEARRRR